VDGKTFDIENHSGHWKLEKQGIKNKGISNEKQVYYTLKTANFTCGMKGKPTSIFEK